MTDELVRRINELDNRTVLLILGFVAQDLQQEVPAEQTTVIQSEEDTRLAIASFLAPMGESTGQLDAVADIQDNARLAALGRRLLVLLLEDEAARPKVEDLVSNSPEDAQMDFGAAIAGALILGAVITRLQTKVHIKVTRTDGKKEFEFEVNKDAADQEVVKDVARSVSSLLTGPHLPP